MDEQRVTDAEFTVISGPTAPPPSTVVRPPWWARDPDRPDKPWDWRWYTRADRARYWIAYVAFILVATVGAALLIGWAAAQIWHR